MQYGVQFQNYTEVFFKKKVKKKFMTFLHEKNRIKIFFKQIFL